MAQAAALPADATQEIAAFGEGGGVPVPRKGPSARPELTRKPPMDARFAEAVKGMTETTSEWALADDPNYGTRFGVGGVCDIT